MGMSPDWGCVLGVACAWIWGGRVEVCIQPSGPGLQVGMSFSFPCSRRGKCTVQVDALLEMFRASYLLPVRSRLLALTV